MNEALAGWIWRLAWMLIGIIALNLMVFVFLDQTFRKPPPSSDEEVDHGR